jgi:hypothetical protein
MSRITYLMLQSNAVLFINTSDRSECWITKDGTTPHALMLSCSLDKRQEMEKVVADVKAGVYDLVSSGMGPIG